MPFDTIFTWPMLVEGTVQAEPLVNEMLGRIIAGTVRVNSWGDTSPPVGLNFEAYIIGTGATGAWSGQDNKIAVYLDGWKFFAPVEGHRVRVNDQDIHIYYDGTNWQCDHGIQTLTDGATINWDAAQGRAAVVTLGGNRTVAAPTHIVDGESYVLHVVQDGTGTRTLTWNAVFHWPAATAPTLTVTAGKIDVFRFDCRGGLLYGSTVGLNYT